jgi:hypothetical protein
MAKKGKSAPDDIIKGAMERFEESEAGTSEDRSEYMDDWKFARLADQWPAAIKKQRTQEARPVLVINKLPALIRSVVNESRKNKPSIKISPVDNGADEDAADVIGGLIRSVERASQADLAYDTAIDQAVTGGFGFFRISLDWAHEDSFDLEARIERIPYAPQVHWDATSKGFDSKDWDYAFISDFMTKRQFEKSYPDASMVPFDGTLTGLSFGSTVEDDSIRIAEYFLREEKQRKIVMLARTDPTSGQEALEVVREEHLPAMAKEFFNAGEVEIPTKEEDDLVKSFLDFSGTEIRRERMADYHSVIRRVINGVEVLDESEWPGSIIPICPVWGDEVYDEQGRRHFRSLIRDAKDPQQMFNFWRSATTELVALTPKAPWVGPVGFVPKDMQAEWQTANTRSHQYLEYEGNIPPSRQAFAGVPTGAMQEALSANDDMKSITGIFDSSLGARSNETSGRAIMARERQGDVSNFHFLDNLSRAIRSAGEILVEIIPAVYSQRGTIRILGADMAEKVVTLTQQAGGAKQKGPEGSPALYNLTVGKYDVDVKTGPTFTTQREETRETLIEIMRQVPDAAAYLGDVLLDHMDFVGAEKVSQRLRSLLPKEVRDAEDSEMDSENPEAARLKQQLQAQGQEYEQIKEQVMAEVQKVQAENEQLKQNHQAAQMKAQGDLAMKDRELGLKEREVSVKEDQATLDALKESATQEEIWEYDRQIAGDQNNWQAEQNRLDRLADLAKTIINKSEGDEDEGLQGPVIEAALSEADGRLPQ